MCVRTEMSLIYYKLIKSIFYNIEIRMRDKVVLEVLFKYILFRWKVFVRKFLNCEEYSNTRIWE